jgi:hypothetical protein
LLLKEVFGAVANGAQVARLINGFRVKILHFLMDSLPGFLTFFDQYKIVGIFYLFVL